MTLVLLELNEINFDAIRGYAAQGRLPTLAGLIERYGVARTTSEQNYEELEPWIQWVTAHTGMSLAEHGVFRLGDIVVHDFDQIWEVLEREGVTVGAISPMNAKNRCAAPAFFIPDPWTDTRLSGPGRLQRLYPPIAQAVNDNATSKLTLASVAGLAVGLVQYARARSLGDYFGQALGAARGKPWFKAMLLDRLLADVFIREVRAQKPGFSSLFLNAGAHIQHHYMFNSSVYDGSHANPAWYVSPSDDPVFDVYDLYDRIVADVMRAVPDARIMLATGLHQNPHSAVTFYWRLRDHATFLTACGVPFARVEPRMSRDFVVVAHSVDQALAAQRRLEAITSADGQPLFDVDNRGDSLFVMLVWPHDVENVSIAVGGVEKGPLKPHVAFVAVKNGEHDGTGYFLDTGAAPPADVFPLADLPAMIAEACGVHWTQAERVAAE